MSASAHTPYWSAPDGYYIYPNGTRYNPYTQQWLSFPSMSTGQPAADIPRVPPPQIGQHMWPSAPGAYQSLHPPTLTSLPGNSSPYIPLTQHSSVQTQVPQVLSTGVQQARQTPRLDSVSSTVALPLGPPMSATGDNTPTTATEAFQPWHNMPPGYSAWRYGSRPKATERFESVPFLSRSMKSIHQSVPNTPGEYEELDPRYRTRRAEFFKKYRVFTTMWPEPANDPGSNAVSRPWLCRDPRFGQWIYSKIRRFIVVKEGSDKCICLPIVTLRQSGTSKVDVNKHERAIAYADKHPPIPLSAEQPTRGEKPMRTSIRIISDEPGDKLDELSRVDYSRVYTVEKNIKARAFGWVHRDSEKDLDYGFFAVFMDEESHKDRKVQNHRGKGQSKKGVSEEDKLEGDKPQEDDSEEDRSRIDESKEDKPEEEESESGYHAELQGLIETRPARDQTVLGTSGQTKTQLGIHDQYQVMRAYEESTEEIFNDMDITANEDSGGESHDDTDRKDKAKANAVSEKYSETNGSATSMMTTTTTNVYSEIRKELSKAVAHLDVAWVELELFNWALVEFFKEQFDRPAEVSLDSVICVIGTGSKAEAATCGEYVRRTWPTMGNAVLSKMTEAVHKALESGIGSDYPTPESTLKADENFFKIILSNLADQPTASSVTLTTSSQTALVEAAEILCWLGATCRESRYPDKLSYCNPRVLTAPHSKKVQVTYEYSDLEVGPSDSGQSETCWHLLFKNPVITKGYPILLRAVELPGLQLSPDMMTTLSKANRATVFDGTLLVKGLYSMFVPIKRVGPAIVWHYLVNIDRTWMLFNHARERCRTVATVLPSHLEGATHFVAWTRSSSILAGTKHASYDTIDYTGANTAKSGLALEDIAINAGFTFGFEFGLGTKIVPGKKDALLPLTIGGMYEDKIHAAESTKDVMYDTQDKRAWLLDGATVLLHMTRARLSHNSSCLHRLGSSSRLIEAFRYPDGNIDGISSAFEALVDKTNRKLPLKEPVLQNSEPQTSYADSGRVVNEKESVLEDLILNHFETLEQIKGYQARMRSRQQMNVRSGLSQPLHGWGFVDIISGKTIITPRAAGLKRSSSHWLSFTAKSNAINILGSSLGQLIKPSQLECKKTTLLPCGMDFLAAQVKTLLSIAQEFGSVDREYVQLVQGAYWNFPYMAFHSLPCCCVSNSTAEQQCGRNPITQVAGGHPSKLRRNAWGRSNHSLVEKEDVLMTCSLGAVIFGHRDDWKKLLSSKITTHEIEGSKKEG